MKQIIFAIIFAAVAFAQKVDHGTEFRSLRVTASTSTTSSGDCDAAAEEGSIHVQTGDPASVATRVSVCTKTGASSWAWNPISHKVGTTAPATCAVGEVFFDSDATAGSNWYGCTASNTWTLLGGGGSSSFDYPLATEAHMFDEFTHASATSNTMGWLFSGGTGSYTAAESGRPGLFRRATSSTINTVAYTSRSSSNSITVLPADTFSMTWIVRVNTTTNQTVRVGLNCGAVSAAQPAAGMYFELSNAGNWYAVNRTGNVETGTNQDTTVASSTGFVRLSIRRSSTNIIFAIDGTDRITQSSNVPTSVCNPWTMITNTAGEDKTMDHDLAYLKVSGLSR